MIMEENSHSNLFGLYELIISLPILWMILVVRRRSDCRDYLWSLG
jgi:hypothetical protein